MSARGVLAETATPEGVRVVLFADTWRDHIVAGHGELAPHLDAALSTVAAPDHREPDDRPARERFFKRDVGPSRWLMVVIDFSDTPARIVTRPRIRPRTIAGGMDRMSIQIDGLIFDRANYDADGDVLYLARGETAEASDAALTPEGHGVRYDTAGQVIGVTIVNARFLLERDGHLTITLPREVRIGADDLAGALT